MASNRKLPFGYRMEQGEIKEHPVEAEAVRDIFSRYLAGASFAALANYMRDNGPPYDGDKSWNKNMVARILEITKYTGDGRFPAVVLRTSKRSKRREQTGLHHPQKRPRRKSFGGYAVEILSST